MFTARNRQNPFAKRRRAQADAEQAEASAAPFDANKSPDHVETPDIATIAGTVVEPPADEPSQIEQEIEAETSAPEYVKIPVLTPELQAKIDAVANRAIPPADEPQTDVANGEDETAYLLSTEANAERLKEAVADVKRGRGRPRPMETIVRDGKVYDLLKAADAVEGVSKEALAITLGEKEQQVYSSLRQLTKEGRAETRYVKGHGYRWFAL